MMKPAEEVPSKPVRITLTRMIAIQVAEDYGLDYTGWVGWLNSANKVYARLSEGRKLARKLARALARELEKL